jgi:hypothetical protein
LPYLGLLSIRAERLPPPPKPRRGTKSAKQTTRGGVRTIALSKVAFLDECPITGLGACLPFKMLSRVIITRRSVPAGPGHRSVLYPGLPCRLLRRLAGTQRVPAWPSGYELVCFADETPLSSASQTSYPVRGPPGSYPRGPRRGPNPCPPGTNERTYGSYPRAPGTLRVPGPSLPSRLRSRRRGGDPASQGSSKGGAIPSVPLRGPRRGKGKATSWHPKGASPAPPPPLRPVGVGRGGGGKGRGRTKKAYQCPVLPNLMGALSGLLLDDYV